MVWTFLDNAESWCAFCEYFFGCDNLLILAYESHFLNRALVGSLQYQRGKSAVIWLRSGLKSDRATIKRTNCFF